MAALKREGGGEGEGRSRKDWMVSIPDYLEEGEGGKVPTVVEGEDRLHTEVKLETEGEAPVDGVGVRSNLLDFHKCLCRRWWPRSGG